MSLVKVVCVAILVISLGSHKANAQNSNVCRAVTDVLTGSVLSTIDRLVQIGAGGDISGAYAMMRGCPSIKWWNRTAPHIRAGYRAYRNYDFAEMVNHLFVEANENTQQYACMNAVIPNFGQIHAWLGHLAGSCDSMIAATGDPHAGAKCRRGVARVCNMQMPF